MPVTSAIHEFLREAHVAYRVIPHRPAFSALDDAEATNVPGGRWAKVVSCFVDGRPIEAVVPAPLFVKLDQLLELAGGNEIHVAREEQLPRLFPGCELGAMPPFGSLYGQPVFVDLALASESEIAFDGGTHTEAIAMRWSDFVAVVKPIVGQFAAPPSQSLADFGCQ